MHIFPYEQLNAIIFIKSMSERSRHNTFSDKVRCNHFVGYFLCDNILCIKNNIVIIESPANTVP